MSDGLTDAQRALLPHVNNPTNEDRWGLAIYIAHRADIDPRAAGQMLQALERRRLVESMRQGRRGTRAFHAPRLWRRVAS